MGITGNARLLSILNLIGYVATLVVNGLANALPIGGKNTGELSDAIPNLFVPAGLTFSIWGLIYIVLGVFVVYQAIVVFGKNAASSSFTARIGYLFFISSLANLGWIFAWQYQVLPLSLVLMLILLGSLIAVYLRLDVGRSDAGNKEKYMVHLPFSIYLGWITIATVANVTALLVKAGWNGFGLDPQYWTVLMLLVGLAITMVMLFQRHDIFYALVVDWAILGILIKRTSLTIPAQAVIITATAGLAIVTAIIVAQLIRKKIY
jgi:hypothetical protein